MGKMIDISGKQYGRWIVIGFNGMNKSGGSSWFCKCECGTERVVDGRSLRYGTSQSCGCLSAEKRLASKQNYIHGGKNERLYNVWNNIKNRCTNQNSKHYCDYGGRGIDICDEWRYDYAAFRKWATANGYDDSGKKYACTLDRIDNNKGYNPENCRWVPQKVQCNNRRNNHRIVYNGESHTLSEWSSLTGIRKDTLRRRIVVYRWPIERALTEKTIENNTQAKHNGH